MTVPGVASVTFRNLMPEEVVELAVKADLKSIEWGGDMHAPLGNLHRAHTIAEITRNAGLSVSAYGSYYTIGKENHGKKKFEQTLQIAQALDAPIIRIWAGERASKNVHTTYRNRIMSETHKIADIAGDNGIMLAFEFHDNTLNDTYTSCEDLISGIDHSHVKTYWQPIHGLGKSANQNGIAQIKPWIIGVHVFHWWPAAENRHSLCDGKEDWIDYFSELSTIPYRISGSLEFVKNDSPMQFLEDAKTLLEILRLNQIVKPECE